MDVDQLYQDIDEIIYQVRKKNSNLEADTWQEAYLIMYYLLLKRPQYMRYRKIFLKDYKIQYQRYILEKNKKITC